MVADVDDVVDLLLPHPIEHRQAQNLMRIALSDGLFSRVMAEVLIACRQVRRNRIVDDRRDAVRLQIDRKSVV